MSHFLPVREDEAFYRGFGHRLVRSPKSGIDPGEGSTEANRLLASFNPQLVGFGIVYPFDSGKTTEASEEPLSGAIPTGKYPEGQE